MKEEKIQYYEGAYADEFPMGPYFRDQFNTVPSSLRYDYPFNYKKLIEYLTKSQYLKTKKRHGCQYTTLVKGL